MQTNKNLDTTLSLAQDATNNILSDSFLQEKLIDSHHQNYLDVLEIKRLREIMNNVFRESNLIQYIELETRNKQIIDTGLCSNQLINDQLRKEAESLNGRTYWYITDEKICNSYDSEMIIGVRKVLNHQKLNENLGYLTFTINTKFFNNILKQKNDLQQMHILLSQQEKVFTNTLVEKEIINENSELLSVDWEYVLKETDNHNNLFTNEHLFFSDESDYTGWRLIGVIPEIEITTGLNKIILFTLAVISVLIIINIILISIFSSFIIKPIKDIISKMNLVSSGDFNATYNNNKFYNEETEQLAENFNFMVANIQYLVKEIYEKENQERKAEIRFLQAQINPHFLYNTLDNIYWGLEDEGKSKVSELILSLSKILRYALDRNYEVTSLRKELKYVDHYLYIMSYRFQGRMKIERCISDHLLSCAIPRLLIQPIIENAIIHGLEPKGTDGILKIFIELVDGAIHLHIEDNGVGMTKEQINSIYTTDDESDHKGLGILNVHNRIHLHYGRNFGVKIKSHIGYGTRVSLIFPYSVNLLND